MPTIIDDVEERKSILAAIIDSSEDAIISKNLNSVITSWNKAAERMFGYTEEEAVGKHIFLIIPKELQSEEEMIINNLRHGKRIEHYQTIRMTKNGKLLDISLTISPIKNSTGKIVGASKIARDITKQKEDERTIKKYMLQLEIINSIGKTIAAKLDVNSILKSVVISATKLSGAQFGAFFYNKFDSKGNSRVLYAFDGLPNDLYKSSAINVKEDIFSNPETINISINNQSEKISLFPFDIILQKDLIRSYLCVPAISKDGDIVGKLFFAHYSADKFQEEHVKLVEAIASLATIALENGKLYEEVQALNSRKDEFIGFASHELKTPLTTIIGYLQLSKTDPQNVMNFIPKIEKQVDRLRVLIADLLDISKIHAGELTLNYREVSLQSIISETLEVLRNESHTIIKDLPEKNICVTVDNDKIIQVLINVLGNAIKYSEAGSKILIAAKKENDIIEIKVSDHGIGISPLELPKIFNQFYRVNKTNLKIPGLGIGLYISKEIIEIHGGKITVESEAGKGSVFTITFPESPEN